MYNLFVSADSEAWESGVFKLEIDRCVKEYTDPDINARLSDFSEISVNELKSFPCIFAYEKFVKKDPHLGQIVDVQFTQDRKMKIKYRLHHVSNFISHELLNNLNYDLDISKMELYRTHWAVKDIDLSKSLKKHGIDIQEYLLSLESPINLNNHEFQVALSFPGEHRDFVEPIAMKLRANLGPDSCFYDRFYVPQLARPKLDNVLQRVYKSQAQLIVVFLSAEYDTKEWCGLEFDAIRELKFDKQDERIMYVRLDYAHVDGVLKTDGYVDATNISPHAVASMIETRLQTI